MKNIIGRLYSIKIHDNEQVASLLGSIQATIEVVCHSSLKFEQVITKLSNNKKQSFYKSGVSISSSHDLFPYVIRYAESSHIKSKYLDIPLTSLARILSAILNSNDYWHE